jgi:hypothetical protein
MASDDVALVICPRLNLQVRRVSNFSPTTHKCYSRQARTHDAYHKTKPVENHVVSAPTHMLPVSCTSSRQSEVLVDHVFWNASATGAIYFDGGRNRRIA